MSVMTKAKLQMRPMQVEDLDAVVRIEPTLYSHPWTRTNFQDSLKSGHSAWVMLMDDEVVAYALMMVVLDEASLLNISVAKPYQRQGFGQDILQHMIDRAKTAQASTMFLEVRQSNQAALSLYEKMGFAEMSVRRGYYPAATGREDAVLMGLTI